MTKKYRIEFGELRIGTMAMANLATVCKSNWASAGPMVTEFEKKWHSLFWDKGGSVAVASGTAACITALTALYDSPNKKKGVRGLSEVIVPALSFIATSNAVLAAGFKPVFVDVELDTLNIDPLKIEKVITPNTVAIMPVHTMGKPAAMDSINAIAAKHNLTVIEDACEAHGARYKGKFIGTIGDMSCYSFYIAHLICAGEGGMVSTTNPDIVPFLKSTRSHGRAPDSLYFDHLRFGLNHKMNDLEASLGLEGVNDFWETFRRRKYNLYFLMNKLAYLSDQAYMNKEEAYENVCPHGFTVTLKDDDPKRCQAIQAYLDSCGIKVKRNFGCIPTQHRAFEFMGHRAGDFPAAEHIGNNGFHFGVHQYLQEDDLEYIVKCVSDAFNNL